MATSLAPTRKRSGSTSKHQKWTSEEDALLHTLVMNKRIDKGQWKSIASSFPTKTPQQVFERWTKVLDPNLTKGSWTPQEDQIIINFVQHFGTKNWTKLSEQLPGRIGKQCRERWFNHLNPGISVQPWTYEEDQILYRLHQQLGNKWAKISTIMRTRPDNAIKNRWYSTVSKMKFETRQTPGVSTSTQESVAIPPFPIPPDVNFQLPKIISPLITESPQILKSQPNASPINNTLFSSPSLKENRAELISLLSCTQ